MGLVQVQHVLPLRHAGLDHLRHDHRLRHNSYLNLSLFLGFALLYPDFQVNLFFFLPVRVKYLALIDAAGLAVSFVMGTASTRIALVMALLNVLLFFGGNLIQRIKSAYRRYKWKKSFRE